MARLKVAILAPPWLQIPPKGYGGIEMVLVGLIQELAKKDVDVEVFTVGAMPGFKTVKVHSLYKTEQYEHIHKPMYESLPILAAHMLFSLDEIARQGDFDIIHDHNGFFGPALLRWVSEVPGMPPAIHTNHGPPFTSNATLSQCIPDNRPFWRQLAVTKRLFVVGISESLMRLTPEDLKGHVLPAVYNAIDATQFTFYPKKDDYFVTMARFNEDKGEHIAAELCRKHHYRLKMAGTVAGIMTPKRLLLELANPNSKYRNFADFSYYSDKILPFTALSKRIQYVGNLGGRSKQRLLGLAKALLFPIQWEEPFGMAVIEAMACGTPVVAMNRGAMPEIIQHGVNGFLANSVEEFEEYMTRVGEISPEACRKSVEDHFSISKMADDYIDRYKEVIRRTTRPFGSPGLMV
jgi:glycosyltransferase involved in cell wall biosynthesis